MTVKELFQSLDFKDIIESLKKKYPDALLLLSEYKENYDIICNTEFSGRGGEITFRPDGDSTPILPKVTGISISSAWWLCFLRTEPSHQLRLQPRFFGVPLRSDVIL